MLNEKDYIIESLELHLFFARIMKEHSIFLEAGFTPVNADLAKAANYYKQQFEEILQTSFTLGNGKISPTAVASREFVTDFTYGSEQKTTNFTGIAINTGITRQQAGLWGNPNPQISPDLEMNVSQLNAMVRPVLDDLIKFKTDIINDVLSCRIFTANYPEEGKHILEEAKNYKELLTAIENRQHPYTDRMKEQKFWDHKMKEHSEFIRGKLDTTEEEFFNEADNFAEIFKQLSQKLESSQVVNPMLTEETINNTQKLRDFKQDLTDGINRCQIRSVMMPLYTDHILREANYYLRLLRTYNLD